MPKLASPAGNAVGRAALKLAAATASVNDKVASCATATGAAATGSVGAAL